MIQKKMTKHLQDLLEAAKGVVLTPEEKEQQRRSFAYGNVATKIRASRARCFHPITPKTGIPGTPACHPITPKPGVLGTPDYYAADEIGPPKAVAQGLILEAMAHAIRVDSPFATVHDTADTLGVSKARTNTLIEQARRITSRILRRSSGGELVNEAQRKRRSGRTLTASNRLNGGTKSYQRQSKKAKAKR